MELKPQCSVSKHLANDGHTFETGNTAQQKLLFHFHLDSEQSEELVKIMHPFNLNSFRIASLREIPTSTPVRNAHVDHTRQNFHL